MKRENLENNGIGVDLKKKFKEATSGAADLNHYLQSLCYIEQNKRRVLKKISNGQTLNVVFVVQYIPGWNKQEPIYAKMKADPGFNPVIVCVPLNIQKHKLLDKNGNDTYRYFTEHGYEAIDALRPNGSWYDLKQLEPDYVFHSRPYNTFMPKPYTSSEIVQYALICNVLYGPNLSVNGQDVTLDPKYFRDCFCYFSFDETEAAFYRKRFRLGIKTKVQKCLPYGAIAIEQILRDRRKVAKEGFRKTVMWTTRWSTDPYIGGCNYFKYKDTMRRLVENNPDVFFIFRPHPLMLDNFLKTGEMTAEDVEQLRDYCSRTDNLILDEEKEYADQFYASDILITDGSGMVPEYFALNKPIMFCSKTDKYVEWSKQMVSACYEIKDEVQLEETFYDLINGKDSMAAVRGATFEKLFRYASKNSARILRFLKRER